MIHIYIPLIISFILVCAIKKKYLFKIIFGLITLACLVFIVSCMTGNTDIIDKIPYTSYDTSGELEVSNNGVMSLEWSTSTVDKHEYIITGDYDSDSVKEFLESSQKSIIVYIKEKDSIVYSSNLGLATDTMYLQIKDIYETWKTSGVVPRDKIRYKVLCFYFDV